MDRVERLRREAKELREHADRSDGGIARECRAEADDLDALAEEQESERLMHQQGCHRVGVGQ